MKAIDRMYKNQTNLYRTNVAMGRQVGYVMYSEIDVTEETIRRQLREDGFYTKNDGFEGIYYATRKELL